MPLFEVETWWLVIWLWATKRSQPRLCRLWQCLVFRDTYFLDVVWETYFLEVMVTRGSCDERRAPSLYHEIAGHGNTLFVTCNSHFFPNQYFTFCEWTFHFLGLNHNLTLQLSFSLRPATTFFEWPPFSTGAFTAIRWMRRSQRLIKQCWWGWTSLWWWWGADSTGSYPLYYQKCVSSTCVTNTLLVCSTSARNTSAKSTVVGSTCGSNTLLLALVFQH